MTLDPLRECKGQAPVSVLHPGSQMRSHSVHSVLSKLYTMSLVQKES